MNIIKNLHNKKELCQKLHHRTSQLPRMIQMWQSLLKHYIVPTQLSMIFAHASFFIYIIVQLEKKCVVRHVSILKSYTTPDTPYVTRSIADYKSWNSKTTKIYNILVQKQTNVWQMMQEKHLAPEIKTTITRSALWKAFFTWLSVW